MSELVKHYQNDMKNIPQLRNEWGSMINLLDKVLVDGFNFIPVISITKVSNDSITATIALGTNHGFIDRQVIRISGSTNGWDGDYKVLSANTNNVVIECAIENTMNLVGAAYCSTAPLDFEIVFQTPKDSTKPKRAYRSKNPESLGLILLVHDFCIDGAAINGAKFVKVGVVSSMSDIDNITGSQMPYDASKPDANWGWDGVNHGWAKWYYAVANGVYANTSISDTDQPSNVTRPFTLAGCSSNGFVLSIETATQNGVLINVQYGFVEFQDDALIGKNLILIAFGVKRKYAQDDGFPAVGRGGIVHFGTADNAGSSERELKGCVWYNSSGGGAQYNTLKKPYYLDSDRSSKLVSNLCIIDSNAVYRGIVPFFRASTLESNLFDFDSKHGKHRWFYSIFENSRYSTCAMMLKTV